MDDGQGARLTDNAWREGCGRPGMSPQSSPGEMSGRCYSRRWSRARCVVRLLGPAYHRYGRDVRSVQRLFAEAILPVFFPRREIGWKIAIGRRALPVNEFDLAHWASPRTKKDDDP